MPLPRDHRGKRQKVAVVSGRGGPTDTRRYVMSARECNTLEMRSRSPVRIARPRPEKPRIATTMKASGALLSGRGPEGRPQRPCGYPVEVFGYSVSVKTVELRDEPTACV